jgi:biotin operon repressor
MVYRRSQEIEHRLALVLRPARSLQSRQPWRQEIEHRLALVLRLLRKGRYSTPKLAAKLGVSVPTISRCIESLRDRGYVIRSLRGGDNWRYVVESNPISGRRQRANNRLPAHASS